ncbi:MAG TPA: hypothetical protein VGF15_07050 [Solirubrobacteraceae bacterium]|jgi:hypothetical protein
MHEFENRLWSDLLREHGSELTLSEKPTARKRPRLLGIGAAALTLLAVTIAVAVSLTANSASPAYAVTKNPDGTVTITIAKLVGVSPANSKLARLGVRARARADMPFPPGCSLTRLRPDSSMMSIVHPTRQPFALKIDPGAIPANTTLLISAVLLPIHHTPTAGAQRHAGAIRIALIRDPLPACALQR